MKFNTPAEIHPPDLEQEDIWSLLVERHVEEVRRVACPQYLSGLTHLWSFLQSIPTLDDLSQRIAPYTPWRLVSSTGMADRAEFFESIAERRFPVAMTIRSRAELNFSALPDMFHDIAGHAPLLMHADGAALYERFGDIARRGRFDVDLLRRLDTLFWFTFEVGLIREEQAVKVLGAAILTSPREMKNIRLGERQIEEFDLPTVLASSYEATKIQPHYFVLKSLAEVDKALDCLDPAVAS